MGQKTPSLQVLQKKRKKKKRRKLCIRVALFALLIVGVIVLLWIMISKGKAPASESDAPSAATQASTVQPTEPDSDSDTKQTDAEPEETDAEDDDPDETADASEESDDEPEETVSHQYPFDVVPLELDWDAVSQGDLVLVNADYGIDPDEVEDLCWLIDEKTDHYYLRDTEIAVTATAADHLNDWMEDFYVYSGSTTLNVVAGYRDEEYQQSLREQAIENHDIDYADSYIALPRHSEHHTGLAIDLDTMDIESGDSGGFDGTGVYSWVVEHAWEYGFVQRYPPDKEDITGINYEEWHFRYVGLPHAMLMYQWDLCLEEYLDELRDYRCEGPHLSCTCQGTDYRIYYCPADSVLVPADLPYEISGDNDEGFIITVKMN